MINGKFIDALTREIIRRGTQVTITITIIIILSTA